MTGEQPDARDAEGIDPLRRKLVLGARERWIRKLIDPGRRNNLLFYRDLKAGTLGLDAKPEILGQLLGKKWLELEQLVGDIEVPPHITDPAEREREQRELEKEGVAEVRHRLVTIQRTALSNLEEKGLDTLFAACGLAQWPAADEGRPYAAPVLLLPVHIESPGRGTGISISTAPIASWKDAAKM